MGDEVLVTGEARHLQDKDPHGRRVIVVDRMDRHRWHPLWEGNPRIVRPGGIGPRERCLRLENAARTRPYIDWSRMREDFEKVHGNRPFTTKGIRDPLLPWRFSSHKVKRGELYTRRLPKQGYVVIEPYYKTGVSPNRDWGFERWQTVVDAVDANWWQINGRGTPLLKGVCHKPAETFMRACELLSGARLYVGPEGGLYHAAAALGVPAVAIFGGFVSPETQGYPESVNLYEPMEGQSPCGQRIKCPHCQVALARITPDRVIAAVEEMLGQ